MNMRNWLSMLGLGPRARYCGRRAAAAKGSTTFKPNLESLEVRVVPAQATFSLDNDASLESSATSEKGGNIGGADADALYQITNTVRNGTTGTFVFDWTATGAGLIRMPIEARRDAMTPAVRQQTEQVGPNQPVLSRDGQIAFTKTRNTNPAWGGTFPAQRYIEPAQRNAAVQLNTPVVATLSQSDGETVEVQFTSEIIYDSDSGLYVFSYTVENDSASAFNASWAGFNFSVGANSTATQTTTSPSLTGSLVNDSAVSIDNLDGDSCSTGASYWDPTPVSSASTWIGVSSSSATVGDSVTFAASVSGMVGTPTGNVTFVDSDGTVLGVAALSQMGETSLVVSTLAVGNHDVTAIYSGDDNYGTSSSGDTMVTVYQANPMLSPNSPPSSVQTGQTFTLSATVFGMSNLTPTGTITFILVDSNNNQTELGSDSLDSNGTVSLDASVDTPGDYTVLVEYSGDVNYVATSTSFSLSVYSS